MLEVSIDGVAGEFEDTADANQSLVSSSMLSNEHFSFMITERLPTGVVRMR